MQWHLAERLHMALGAIDDFRNRTLMFFLSQFSKYAKVIPVEFWFLHITLFKCHKDVSVSLECLLWCNWFNLLQQEVSDTLLTIHTDYDKSTSRKLYRRFQRLLMQLLLVNSTLFFHYMSLLLVFITMSLIIFALVLCTLSPAFALYRRFTMIGFQVKTH